MIIDQKQLNEALNTLPTDNTTSEKPTMETTESPQPEKAETNSESEITFDELGLQKQVLEAVTKAGYETPTPIQAQIIPRLLEGRDILAQSQTGTGKTAAFALPILSKLKKRTKVPQVLVLAPTRELGIQVAKSFASYGKCLDNFAVAAIYGGQDYEPQLKQLRRGVQVVVGTPGRVIDHIKRGTLDLSQLRCVVLDEADEMLNMGFLEDVEFVLDKTPDACQVALFSATLPKPIQNIAQKYLTKPAKVTIKKKTMTADSIRQRAVIVPHRDKLDVLIRFLEAEETDGVIVFTRTRESTNVVAEQLAKTGLTAVALNGELAQKTRERTIERLKAGQINVLVATDVAARGLDVERISHVFNFDLPEGTESYVHRVGRTGRAGRKGEAIIFVSKMQQRKLKWIEQATRQPIEIVDPPTFEAVNAMRIERFKKQIAETAANTDLSFFQKLLDELANDSGLSYEMMAAAIAHLKQNGQDFLMKKRPKPKRSDRDFERDGGGRRSRGRSRGPAQGMSRYRLAVGKRDGIHVGAIVGVVANEGGIDGDRIGPIRVFQSYSTIDLPEGMPADVYETLRTAKMKGRALNISPARESDGGSGYRSGGNKRKRRGNDSGRGRNRGFKAKGHADRGDRKARGPKGKRGKRKEKTRS